MDTIQNDFLRINAYFSRPRSKRDVNIANTVLVRHDKSWHLGFLQDVEGDSVLINHNCRSLPTAWIHKEHVFTHPLVGHPVTDLPVYVAVRLEENGPYVFVPGRQLNNLHSALLIRRVEVDLPNGVSITQIVHRQQIIYDLPVTEPREPMNFEKRVMQYEMPIFREGTDEAGFFRRRDEKEDLFDDFERGLRVVERQFYLAVHNDSAVFIWWNADQRFNLPPWNQHFTVQKLKKLFAKHALAGVISTFPAILDGSAEAAEQFGTGSFPMELFGQVVQWSDVHSQISIKRVCASWFVASVAFTPLFVEFVTIDMRKLKYLPSELHLCTESYHLALLLHYILRPSTKIIQFSNFDSSDYYCDYGCMEHLEYVALLCKQLCVLKNVTPRAVCITNCTVSTEMRWSGSINDIEWKLQNIGLLLEFAHLVIIRDYTIGNPLAYLGYRLDHFALPIIQEVDVLDSNWSARRRAVITSHVVFRRTETHAKRLRGFLGALEKHCREPTDICQTKVKALFELWIQVVPYPDGWQGIRDMLRLLDHRYYPDGQLDYRAWDNVDLRDLDYGSMSKSKLIAQVIEHNFL